jgi:anti-anti-sigma factor
LEPALEDVQIEQTDPRTAVVSFVGEHDMATADAVEELLGSLIERNDLVVSDLSAAQFVDSSMMRALFHADREAKRQGHTFRLQLGTAPIVRRAFEISGLYELLDICPTREEALAPRAE